MSHGLCRLRIHAPASCPLFVIFSIDATRLPERLRRHEGKVLQVLEHGGTLEVIDPRGTNGNVHNMGFPQWAKLFPDLDLERSWEAGPGKVPGMEAFVRGATIQRHAWQGDPCYSLPELRKFQADGRSLADVIQGLDHGCPSYPIGPAHEQVTLE